MPLSTSCLGSRFWLAQPVVEPFGCFAVLWLQCRRFWLLPSACSALPVVQLPVGEWLAWCGCWCFCCAWVLIAWVANLRSGAMVTAAEKAAVLLGHWNQRQESWGSRGYGDRELVVRVETGDRSKSKKRNAKSPVLPSLLTLLRPLPFRPEKSRRSPGETKREKLRVLRRLL